MLLDPAALSAVDAHRWMITSFIPRPIAFVSTRSPSGVANCAPFSYSMGVSAKPMALAVSVGSRWGSPKDTARNIRGTGEFVVNLVTEEIVGKMNVASADFLPDVSEFAEAGLTSVPSETIGAPRIAESPVNFECRLIREVPVFDASVFFGEVLRLHVRDDLAADGRVDARKLKAVGRLGGAQYCRTTEIFDLPRPEADPAKLVPRPKR